MMNRLFVTVLLATLGLTVAAQDFSAENSEGKVLYYNILPGTSNVAVTYHKKNKYQFESVIIPDVVEYNGTKYTVTEIGEDAFKVGTMKTGKLTKVVLPNTIKVINDGAFRFCPLEDINFPASLERIGVRAFTGLHMDKLELNEGLQIIDDNAFTISYFNEISIPKSVKRIGHYAFVGSGDNYTKMGDFRGLISCLPNFVNTGNAGSFGCCR